MTNKTLWVDVYRPKTLDDYVFQDEQTRKQVETWVKKGETDNILMVGPAGTGKTSLAGVLLNELGIDRSDTLWLNASREGNIETMREAVKSFITSGGWGGLKYVVLDEADGMSQKAQESMKADMEEYSETVRWVLTSNSYRRIIDPIQDRCLKIDVTKPDLASYTELMVNILEAEGISIETEEEFETIDMLIKVHYPSYRGCIRDLQRYTVTGHLERPNTLVKGGGSDWRFKALELFQTGEIREARDFLCKKVNREEIEDVFTWLYLNVSLFSDPDEAIVLIADGLYRHTVVADPEINLSATLTKLSKL